MPKTKAPAPHARKGPKRAPARAPSLPSALWLALILALTFVAYLPSLENGFLNWDDNDYVTENPILAHPSLHAVLTTPVSGNYHPLTMASLLLNYRASGLDPASYHWLNLWLHLANTALVFLFIRALAGPRIWTATVTSLLFGIHPMHVESVAWISARKDVLFAFFYLIALILYVRYLDTRRFAWLGAAWISFVLSCASKPAAVALPLTLGAIDYFRKRPLTAATVLEKVPFLAVSLITGYFTLQAQHSVGAVASLTRWSPLQRVLFASSGLLLYLGKLVAPLRLSAIDPLPATGELGWGYRAAPAAVAVLALGVFLLRRSRPIVFGGLFFLVNLVLVLQVITIGSALIAGRYTYLPYIGLFFAMAWWLDEPTETRAARIKPALATLFLVLLPVCLVQTSQRCRIWHDPETFWNDVIGKYPRTMPDAYYNRADYYHKAGRRQEALDDFHRSLALNDRVPRVWYNAGVVLAEMGRTDSALVMFDRALALDPKLVRALNNRGAMQYYRGNLAGAAADFQRVLELDPTYRGAYGNLARVYVDLGQHARALALLERAIRSEPANPQNYLTRSKVWQGLQDRNKALQDALEAQRLGASVEPAYLRELGR